MINSSTFQDFFYTKQLSDIRKQQSGIAVPLSFKKSKFDVNPTIRPSYDEKYGDTN